jgi:hypothetical protein
MQTDTVSLVMSSVSRKTSQLIQCHMSENLLLVFNIRTCSTITIHQLYPSQSDIPRCTSIEWSTSTSISAGGFPAPDIRTLDLSAKRHMDQVALESFNDINNRESYLPSEQESSDLGGLRILGYVGKGRETRQMDDGLSSSIYNC